MPAIQNEAPVTEPETVLSVRGASKKYGPVTVLKGVDLDVKRGEVVALLGENGAGKSTISSIISGVVQPTAGTMTWQGKPYAPASPSDALNAGIGLIHQEMRLLPDLSITENVFVGRLLTKNGALDHETMERRAALQLKRLGLDISPRTKVSKLRVAAQQQVEIAKALTLEAQLLILDEPTAALGEDETDRLFEQIDALRRQGVSFIYISHRLEEIARIADRVVVMRDGELVARFDTAKVPVRELVQAMVGRPLERMFPALNTPTDRPLIEVEGLKSAEGAFSDISFSVRAGEVFGIAGIIGAGRTELVRAIAGADALAAGVVKVDGRPIKIRHPADALSAGIVLVPEDRKEQGLILPHTIADNIVLGNYGHIARGGWVSPRAITAFSRKAIARFGVKGAPEQPVRELSGGNQQKAVIAKAISTRPRVVILDEPTRGIDVGARASIYEVISGLAREGLAVIVVSSDLDEVLGVAHRVMVLARGRSQGILDHEHANRMSVMERATA